GADVLGPPAHVFLLEARHPVADGGLDFALGFHAAIEWVLVAPTRNQRRCVSAIRSSQRGAIISRSSHEFTCIPHSDRYNEINCGAKTSDKSAPLNARLQVVGRLDEGQP